MGFPRIAAVLFFGISIVASAQARQPIPIETAQTYFAEAQSLCRADDGKLWGVSISQVLGKAISSSFPVLRLASGFASSTPNQG